MHCTAISPGKISPPGAGGVIDGVILRYRGDRGHAGENRVLGDDQPRADGAHDVAIRRLVLEGRSKICRIAEIQDPWQDSTGEGHTPLGQESQGEIAGDSCL